MLVELVDRSKTERVGSYDPERKSVCVCVCDRKSGMTSGQVELVSRYEFSFSCNFSLTFSCTVSLIFCRNTRAVDR